MQKQSLNQPIGISAHNVIMYTDWANWTGVPGETASKQVQIF